LASIQLKYKYFLKSGSKPPPGRWMCTIDEVVSVASSEAA